MFKIQPDLLKRNEVRYGLSVVLDTAGALVVVLDTDGHIRSFNRACELVSGYGFEQVKGRPFWDFLLPPEQVASVKAVFAQLRDGQFPSRHENDWVAKDGGRRRITWSNTCILDRNERVQFIIATGIDITTEVQAKERSRERQRQFRLTAVRTVTILAVSIFLAESTNMVVLAELPGLGPWWSGLLDSVALMVLISPVLYFFAFRPLAGMLRQREQDEEALRRANETLESRVKDRTANLELANQKLEAEMAEREKAQAEVRRAKDEWERTFDAVPDLIAILDEKFRVVRANRAMAERLRLTPGECLGKYCYHIVHGMNCPPDICPNTRTLADGQEHSCDVHEPRLGGDFLITTTPLVDAAGQRIGSVHVARDITERKRAEAELRASYEELARFNRAMVGRELRMIELKQEVNQLRAQAGQPPRYATDRLQISGGADASKVDE